MPPFSAQAPKTSRVHSVIQQTHMSAYFERRTHVRPHCSGSKLVKVRWHADVAIPMGGDQGGVDGDTPTMQRADADFGIGNVITVVCRLPKLSLHCCRPIRIPSFDAIM